MKGIVTFNKKRIACHVSDTFLGRVKGLMFSSPLKKNEGLLMMFPYEQQVDLHMLFVFFSIDAVWIDGKGRIVHIRRRLTPFMPWVSGVQARYVLELASGASDGLQEGEKVTITFKR